MSDSILLYYQVWSTLFICNYNNYRVDLDNLQVKARITIPSLKFDGKYDLDARLLVLPIHGKGDIKATASKYSFKMYVLYFDLLNLILPPKWHIRKNVTYACHNLNILAKCDAEIILQGKLDKKNGVEYLKFVDASTSVDIKDYSVTVTNLFNGDVQMGKILLIFSNRMQLCHKLITYVLFIL